MVSKDVGSRLSFSLAVCLSSERWFPRVTTTGIAHTTARKKEPAIRKAPAYRFASFGSFVRDEKTVLLLFRVSRRFPCPLSLFLSPSFYTMIILHSLPIVFRSVSIFSIFVTT